MKKEDRTLFFCYGSLKRGFWNNYLFDNGEFLGEHLSKAQYTLFEGNFPIVERGGNYNIMGEVFALTDEEEIQNIFDLERCSSRKQGDPNNWYDFDIIDTFFGKAYMFVMDKGKSKRTHILKDGIWK